MGNPNHEYFRMSYVWDIQTTNISECHMYGILNHKYLYQGYSIDILFQSTRGPSRPRSIAVPSGPALFAPSVALPSSHHAPLLSLGPRQAPPTRFAPPKLPQPLVDLVKVASLLARLVCCICQPMWKPGAPVLEELVWDSRNRVA